jgi:hypothetical protein
MISRALFCLLVPCLWTLALSGVADEPLPAGWRAGVARARITPQESMWLSGYGSRDHPSQGTRIDLWAKALALGAPDGTRTVICSLDLVGIDAETADAIRDAISKSVGIPARHVALCSSHTHTGPVVGHNLETMYFFGAEERAKVGRYTAALREDVVRIATEALSHLKPATLSWGVGYESFGVNRRNNPEPLVPAHRAGGRLRGPVDYDVPVLRVADGEGQVRAILFGYACHATVLDDHLWSGDYPGFAQLELERLHPGAQAMFLAGCGADVNPLPRRTPELAQQYGRRLAAAVDRTLEGVLTEITPSLAVRHEILDLPFDTLPTREALQVKAASNDKYAVSHATRMLRELDAHGALPRSYPYPVAVWRLGRELTWVSLGGEVVVEYGLKIKSQFGKQVWVSGYSHDVMAYIPSRRVWEEGGYEGGGSMIYYGLPTRWAGDVEERILGAVGRLLRQE